MWVNGRKAVGKKNGRGREGIVQEGEKERRMHVGEGQGEGQEGL